MNNQNNLDALNEFKEAMLEPDQSETVEGKAPRRKRGRKRQNSGPSDMMLLNTKQPAGISAATIDDYINIKTTSLDMDFNKSLTTVFGDVATIRRALEFVTRPKMRAEHLMKPRFSKESRAHIYSQTASLTNYWALVGYVVIERITQDETLQELLASDKELIAADVTMKRTFRGDTPVIVMDTSNAMYLGVVREVVNCYRAMAGSEQEEISGVFEILIKQLKRDSSLSIFDGTDIVVDGL